MLAHECGHIAQLDGERLLALIRLEFPGLRALRVYLGSSTGYRCAGMVRVLSGGASWQLPIIRPLWQGYFRRSEHRADRVHATSATDTSWRTYLDVYERPVDTATPFRRGRTHPYAEHRIGRLDP